MKIALQYVSDSSGITKSVQIPVTEWEKLMSKIRKYEQALKVRNDLKEAFAEVEKLKKSKAKKQTLNEFLNEL